jgi:lipopolysaccharide export system protein LptC
MSAAALLDRLRAWSALFPLLIVLAGTYWLSRQVMPMPPAPDYKARHDPDVIVTNFSAVALGRAGAPHYLLAASRMEHYPDDDSTYLTEPRLTSPYRDRPPIHMSADDGEVSHNGKEILLRDHVTIVRDAAPNNGELKVTTSFLRVVPDDEIAETDRTVTVTGDRSVTTAKGLRFDAGARVLKLLAQVRTDYEPRKD